jgi:hypothetical protein
MFLNAVQGKYGVKIMTDPNTNQTLYKGKRLAQYYSGYGFELIYTEKMLCTKAGNYSASYTDMYLDRDGTYTGHIPFDEKKMSKKCRDKDIDITYKAGIKKQADEFIKVLSNQPYTLPNLDEAFESMKLINKIYEI